MDNNDKDVAKLLSISQKRAEEILQLCYEDIAHLQENEEHAQMGKSIKSMQHVGQTNNECFYTGFILGRIVQTHMIASFGLTPFLEEDVTLIEKAKEGFKEHPEFG